MTYRMRDGHTFRRVGIIECPHGRMDSVDASGAGSARRISEKHSAWTLGFLFSTYRPAGSSFQIFIVANDGNAHLPVGRTTEFRNEFSIVSYRLVITFIMFERSA